MLILVFTIAILNVCLGAAIAFVLDKRMRAPTLVIESRPAKRAPVVEPPPPEPEVEEEPEEEPPEVCFSLDQLPAEWLKVLEKQPMEPHSFVEAAAELLKLEITDYRTTLIKMEKELRHCRDDEETAELLTEFAAINALWLERQEEVQTQLASTIATAGPYQQLAISVERALKRQAKHIAAFDSAGEGDPLNQLHRLCDWAHFLRDTMNQTIDTIMREENLLDTLDASYLYDGLTKLASRSGLEMQIKRWRKADRAGTRLLSMILCNIDHFGACNHRFGVPQADGLLAAFAISLEELRRSLRGFERPVRFGGQTFLLFLPDTGPRNAMSAAERIRQSIEAITFDLGKVDVEFTVSCGVTEALPSESPEVIYARLQSAVDEAKQQGGNRTAIDEGSGAKIVDPPQFQVRGRVIDVAPITTEEALAS